MFAKRLATLATLLIVATWAIAAEGPERHENADAKRLPAEGFKLPTDKYVAQLAVSPEGRYLMVELTTATRPPQMHEVRLFNVEKGDSVSLDHLLPEYAKLDPKKTGPWLADVDDDGKALILLLTYPSRVGVNVPKTYRFITVDIRDKRVLHDKTFKELDGAAIFRVTRVGTEWWLTVLERDDRPAVKAFDLASGKLRALPYRGGCQGVFSNGDPLLAVDPDKPAAWTKNTRMKDVAWYVRLNQTDKKLTQLAPSMERPAWPHLTRISADAKRLGFCSTSEADDGTKTHHIGVMDISEGKKDPPVLWKKELPGDKHDWAIFLPLGVTNGGALLLVEHGQKRIIAMWPDGSTETLAEDVNYPLTADRCPMITPKRLWYVKQGKPAEDQPPTLHSIDVQALDKTNTKQQAPATLPS